MAFRKCIRTQKNVIESEIAHLFTWITEERLMAFVNRPLG